MDKYLSGLGNHFSSEAIKGALPLGQNSPQVPPLGLYAEQLSGSAFTMPRNTNLRSWLYRINPSVKHSKFERLKVADRWLSTPFDTVCPPDQLRWNRFDEPTSPTDFIHGINTIAGHGSSLGMDGGAIHVYAINKSMTHSFFFNADAEMLFIPQEGNLILKTEFGDIELEPQEIAVIPRGIKFQVHLTGKSAYGYLCENYGSPFRLPDLGPIGANSLANPRDFLTPVAKYENLQGDFELITKFEGNLWVAKIGHSPLDVAAWHGNYAPYKYDLRLFNTIGSISYDHPDPSIFTVLTSPGRTHGMANLDFVIFPPRWMVAENTFRVPYFHRNLMSEFMGLIHGKYDAKPDGFVPGGASLHNKFIPHGPDADSSDKAMTSALEPQFLGNTMAFMLESANVWRPTEFALNVHNLQHNYLDCWQGIKILFKE